MTKFPARLEAVSVEKSRSRRSSAERSENGHTRKFTTETATPSPQAVLGEDRRDRIAQHDTGSYRSRSKTECQREGGPDVQPSERSRFWTR